MKSSKNEERLISRRGFVHLGAGLPIALLAGCSLPGSGERPRRVRLSPAEDFPPNLPQAGWVLQVDEPSATISLNTAKIAIGKADNVEYVKNAQWASRSTEMVMELLVESFQNSGKIITVGDRRARIRPDFKLESQLTNFHIERAGEETGTVRVELTATLIKQPRREAVSSTPFSSSVELQEFNRDAIVAAFNEALQDVMADTVEWTLKTGAAA